MDMKLVCTECDEVMTEPFCAECFGRRVNVWLDEQNASPIIKSSITENVNQLIKATFSLPVSTNNCIICSKKMNTICDYCLMKELFEILKNFKMQEEAELVFNYTIYDLDWNREGRQWK